MISGRKCALSAFWNHCSMETHVFFKTDINKLSAEELRLLPIGKDLKGLLYWFQLDQNLNLRIYCEDQDEETWDLVVRERGELVSLIQNLESGGTTGLKKEEDSTTPSDTGESKDGEASLGIHCAQEKLECLPEEKLQFRVPLLACKEEVKPLLENGSETKEKAKETDELMKMDPNHDLGPKVVSFTVKTESDNCKEATFVSASSVKEKVAKQPGKIKEEPMLIDEDTIVDPEILQKSLSPKMPESTGPKPFLENLSQREESQTVTESSILVKETKEMVNIELQTSFEFLMSLYRTSKVFKSQSLL